MKKILFLLFSVGLISIGLFIILLFNYNPFETDTGIRVLFFLSMFLGMFTVIAGLLIRRRAGNPKAGTRSSIISRSVSQAGLIAVAFVGLAIFSATHVFNWLSVGIYIFVLILLELYLRAKSRPV